MTSKNLTLTFKQEIQNNVIGRMFPNLNAAESNILFKYLVEITELILIKNNLFEADYEMFLKNDNYKDLIGLLFLLLPFIDTKENSTKEIKNLNEIYVNYSKNNSDNIENINKLIDAKSGEILGEHEIHKYEPKFMYSNIQYSRINKNNKNSPELLQFDIRYLQHNFILLKETIITISNKFYINWGNIYPVPYDVSYFTKLPLYKATNKALKNKEIRDYTPYVMLSDANVNRSIKSFSYNGLEINDIYNTIRYNLYEQVYGVKWLLYDIVTKQSDVYNSTKMIISLLEEKLSLENILDGKKWIIITENDRQRFISSWLNFINLIKTQQDPVDFYIMKYFTNFFNTANSYNEIYEKEGYILIDKKIYTKYKKTAKFTYEEYELYLKSFVTIKPEWAYNYLLESITKLFKTWYGQKIKESNSNSYIKFTFNHSPARVTFKNIYNFAKSFSSFTTDIKLKSVNDPNDDSKYVQYNKLWKALNNEDKKIILNRINWSTNTQSNNKNLVTQWFNISNNLKITNNSGINFIDLNVEIHAQIMKKLTTIIFETMTLNGILSHFKPELKINDLDDVKKNISDNEKTIVNNSYYYITNKPFNTHFIEYKNFANEYEKTEYLKFMTSERGKDKSGSWNLIYALNWVSQIAFFHRYLNNRIIYVTGGTGVGKSTQVPKLLLYALKMLDYNYTGKIMATQPRIPPTRKAADTISTQLGVPVFKYNEILNSEIDSDNFYVQFKYAEKTESHVNKTNNLTLTIVTDGILYEILKNNKILKKQIPTDKKKQNQNDDLITYDITGENEQDIIMIDEAHEHNKNMDLCLSLMKNALYYNNSIKLVIVSATMDEDEPRYRRYYRDINDNRMYPFNMSLRENKIDRINVDRRIHIFPPHTTDITTYPITSKWNFDQNKIKELVLELIQKEQGDILLFEPGTKEIKKMVSSLNKILPSNAIAIPYHGKMLQEKKDTVENLNEITKKNLRYPKHVPYDEELSSSDFLVPVGTYDRVVVVATNLAEASITIGTLKFVIETGTQKVEMYDYVDRTSKIVTKNISESSQKQREGRVGRKSPGTVYHTYGMGAMKNNKINYDISTSNIYPILYDLLRDNGDNVIVFDSKYDVNNPNAFDKIKNIVGDFDKLQISYPGNLDKIIIQQYTYLHKNKIEFIDYIGNYSHYDYKNNQGIVTMYKSGFVSDIVNDYEGKFYIIHPEELNLIRNIFGEIVNSTIETIIVDTSNKKIIKSKKIEFAWNNLVETNVIYIIRTENDRLLIKKTKYGKLFYYFYKTLRYKLEDANTLIYSLMFDTLEDTIKIIPFLNIIDYNIKNLTKNSTSLLQLIVKYSNDRSDLQSILMMCNDILNSVGLTEKLSGYNDLHDDTDLVLKYKKIVLENDQLELQRIKQHSQGLLGNLLQLQSQGKLLNDVNNLSEEEKKLNKNNFKNNFIIDYENNFSNNSFVKIFNLDVKYIKFYCADYIDLYIQINKFINDDFSIDDNVKISSQDTRDIKRIKNSINLNKLKKTETINDIVKTFAAGHSYKLFKKICNKYINCFNLEPKLYKTSSYILNKNTRNATFIKSNYVNDYVLALGVSPQDNSIGIISNVSLDIIQNFIVFTYLPTSITRKYDEINKKYYESSDNKLFYEITKQNMNCDYIKTITTIKTDLLKKFTTLPYYLLMSINNDDRKYNEILIKYITEQKNYAITNYNNI